MRATTLSLLNQHVLIVVKNLTRQTQLYLVFNMSVLNRKVLKKIPQHILDTKTGCMDYQNCIQQNPESYGFIPVTTLKLYTGEPTYYETIPDIIRLHCHTHVVSQLNIPAWREYLTTYWDQQLLDLLEFGFPLDFDRNSALHSTELNHKSALDYINHIDQYLQEELSYQAIYGPFDNKPIQMHISPLMSRSEQNSDKRRTIIDLSWPHGASVNDRVSKVSYLDSYFTLTYPSVDNIVDKIKSIGPGAKLFKIDIARAFRQLRVDPGDLDLLGIKHTSYFLDGLVPFGFRYGSGFM